ncbi:hypothetical protein NSA47_03495 [Irregularibacter muris]|uniref:Uncharacterized protein n=1 Tax=Irregularibacter muris TaxID=1796619 RepID=A0AAE3HFF0_9FIRM|nr:hypothetical protein [Irregularibacter muris]MCR1898054.1 hypothetical protein [Irregularibacter muris]
MIQIDDAGSGSLVGGTLIGIYRIETNEYQYGIIPIDYYNEKNFKSKEYLNYVVYIVSNLFEKFNVPLNEEIYVCRGYMFDHLRIWLTERGYNWYSTVIENPLQDHIESSFENYTINLGLPENFIKYTKYPFHFHQLLKWVYADYDNRASLCKTGWKSWKKYGNLAWNTSIDKINKSNYYCLLCGMKILDYSIVKIITYHSNRKYRIYVHENCKENLQK